MFGANELAWTTWAQAHSQDSRGMTAHQQDRHHFTISSCPIFFPRTLSLYCGELLVLNDTISR
jgi:hypothetical protein